MDANDKEYEATYSNAFILVRGDYGKLNKGNNSIYFIQKNLTP